MGTPVLLWSLVFSSFLPGVPIRDVLFDFFYGPARPSPSSSRGRGEEAKRLREEKVGASKTEEDMKVQY